MPRKVLNKEATIQAILEKASNSIGTSINIEKFDAKMQQPDANDFLIKACQFLSISPVYVD